MKSEAIRKAAEGEECTFNIAGVCNYDSSTTVFCHLPDESKGMGKKADDVSGAFGCSACHDAVDQRTWVPEYLDNELFYQFRAWKRTIKRLFELGILSVKGAK